MLVCEDVSVVLPVGVEGEGGDEDRRDSDKPKKPLLSGRDEARYISEVKEQLYAAKNACGGFGLQRGAALIDRIGSVCDSVLRRDRALNKVNMFDDNDESSSSGSEQYEGLKEVLHVSNKGVARFVRDRGGGVVRYGHDSVYCTSEALGRGVKGKVGTIMDALSKDAEAGRVQDVQGYLIDAFRTHMDNVCTTGGEVVCYTIYHDEEKMTRRTGKGRSD